MRDKLLLYIVSNDKELTDELHSIVNGNNFNVEVFNSDTKCVDKLAEKPDILLVDYFVNFEPDIKEKRSILMIEKIKEMGLYTKIFMFSEKKSALFYLSIINK